MLTTFISISHDMKFYFQFPFLSDYGTIDQQKQKFSTYSITAKIWNLDNFTKFDLLKLWSFFILKTFP